MTEYPHTCISQVTALCCKEQAVALCPRYRPGMQPPCRLAAALMRHRRQRPPMPQLQRLHALKSCRHPALDQSGQLHRPPQPPPSVPRRTPHPLTQGLPQGLGRLHAPPRLPASAQARRARRRGAQTLDLEGLHRAPAHAHARALRRCGAARPPQRGAARSAGPQSRTPPCTLPPPTTRSGFCGRMREWALFQSTPCYLKVAQAQCYQEQGMAYMATSQKQATWAGPGGQSAGPAVLWGAPECLRGTPAPAAVPAAPASAPAAASAPASPPRRPRLLGARPPCLGLPLARSWPRVAAVQAALRQRRCWCPGCGTWPERHAARPWGVRGAGGAPPPPSPPRARGASPACRTTGVSCEA